MEVVLLDVFDRGVAVVADGRDGYASFKSKGDPGMAKRVPGQSFPTGHVDLAAIVAVVFGPGGKTRLNEHLFQRVAPNPAAEWCAAALVGEQQVTPFLMPSDCAYAFEVSDHWC